MRAGFHSPRARGFSLVELLVSVLIGLLALVFATRLITGAEQNKASALGGSDSMQNGMLAMFSISGDAQQAGFGLNDPVLVGCNTRFHDTGGYSLAPAARGPGTVFPLAPAVIESGGAGPDRISLYSGSSMTGTGTLRVTSNYIGGTRLDVDRVPSYGFKLGDVVVVAPDNIGAGDCALAQISEDPGRVDAPPKQQYVMLAGGTGFRYNSGALGGANYTAGMARIFNLGPEKTLAFHTWSVNNGFLQLRSTDLAGSGGTAQTVADNIVSIKAQYGFDTRTGGAFTPQDGLQVRRWSATMIDADGSGSAGNAGDYQHIAALRIAVVARSAARERPDADGDCTATADKPVVFASAVPEGVAAAPITVDVGGDDWGCYRYRVFETIVPLRNAGWRP
ncbi:PilW family protein [Massilia sp. IC2-278]|uniref:PilW family protein n=1 Tax=Massilia sp. IC2-278 TaxID=2887200 RepID=UPI001E4578C4|nr:PilW family protein [Massilia sp. IC2-278]MCC2960321.1 PilW family protein [Massilia sp. IC2-278]